MKNILVTGGAGFVGSNLINLFLSKTKYKIISIDNYSTGTIKNHFKNKIRPRDYYFIFSQNCLESEVKSLRQVES